MTPVDPRITRFGGGENDEYEGLLGTNVPEGAVGETIDEAEEKAENPDSHSYMARSSAMLINSGMPVDNQFHTITVNPNTPGLFGGVGDWQTGEIANTSMWVKDPQGNFVNTATDENDPKQLILLPKQSSVENAVLAFTILDPQPGEWSFGLNSDPNTTSLFQYTATTMPSGGVTEMIEVLQSIYSGHEQQQESSLMAESASLFGVSNCTLCKIALYTIALGVVVLGTTGVALLAPESALVGVLVAAVAKIGITVTTATALAFLQGLGAGAIATVTFALTRICEWINLCDS